MGTDRRKFLQPYTFVEHCREYIKRGPVETGWNSQCPGITMGMLRNAKSRIVMVETPKLYVGGKEYGMAIATLDHIFSNGVSYKAYAATDVVVTVLDKGLSFYHDPDFVLFNRMNRVDLSVDYVPNCWLNYGYAAKHPTCEAHDIQGYIKKHLDAVEASFGNDHDPLPDPIWLLAPEPYIEHILKHTGCHDVLRDGSVDPTTIKIFDMVKFKDKNGVVKSAKVVTVLPKGFRLEIEGDRFKVHEKQIVEVIPLERVETLVKTVNNICEKHGV